MLFEDKILAVCYAVLAIAVVLYWPLGLVSATAITIACIPGVSVFFWGVVQQVQFALSLAFDSLDRNDAPLD